MKVQVASSSQILKGFTPWLSLAIPAVLMYWLLFAVVLFFVSKQFTDEQTARIIAIPGAIVLVIIVIILYLRFIVSRLSRYRFELTNDSLVVHGMSGWGFREREYLLSDIQSVVLGQPLNRAEQMISSLNNIGMSKSTGMLEDMKAGRLIVRDTNDVACVFDHVDKAFENSSFLDALAELVQRGIIVEYTE